MNKVYNEYIYSSYYKILNIPKHTVVEPGNYVAYNITTSANYDNDPTENKNKIPVIFGEPIAFEDDSSDPSFGRSDKIPVNLFCKVYYTVLQSDTKKIKISIFAKNFTDEPIMLSGFYLPVTITEFDLMY